MIEVRLSVKIWVLEQDSPFYSDFLFHKKTPYLVIAQRGADSVKHWGTLKLIFSLVRRRRVRSTNNITKNLDCIKVIYGKYNGLIELVYWIGPQGRENPYPSGSRSAQQLRRITLTSTWHILARHDLYNNQLIEIKTAWLAVCVLENVRASFCVCLCLCVCERERERWE